MPRSSSNWSLPASIVIAGALDGLGLYFGLLAQQPQRETKRAPVEEAFAASAVSPEALVNAVLSLHVPALRERCGGLVDPSWQGAHVTLDATFDDAGRQLTRSFLEHRGASRPGLSNCLQEALPQLAVPPLGRTARVELPVDLSAGPSATTR